MTDIYEVEKYEKVAKLFPHDKLLEGCSHSLRLNVALNFLERVGNNKLVLDCGCGDGVQAEKINETHRVIGIDLSLIRVKRAKAKGLDAIVADAYNLPFKKGVFDVVVFGEILEHLTEPEKVLKEINRTLKPKGYLIMDTPSRSNIIDISLRPLMRIWFIKNLLLKIHIDRLREKNLYDKIVNWGLYIDLTHVRFYDMHTIKKLLNLSGFNIIDVRGAPCLRFDFPSIIRPPIFKIVDKVLRITPIIKKYGAIQVFMCQVNNKSNFMENKMKIGIIAYDLSTLAGGTQLSLTLGNELQKEGYEIAYACVYEDLDRLSKKFGHKFNFKIYKMKRPILGRKIVNYSSMFNHSFPIYKMCKEFKPDVVIEIGGHINSLLVPVMLKIPSIHYAHEGSYYYARKNIINKIYFTSITLIERIIAKKVTICTNSNYTAKIIQRSWNINATVIYPPVDTDVFIPDEERENIILCVLRFLPAYKFENLIDAFRKLKRNDYSLVIIGGLTNENRIYYESLRKYVKDEENIKLIANADFNLLLNYYKRSKFFWFPSGAYYGIAVAEAQSAGLPTISFGADSGPGEIIINGKTGYLVANFDEMIERTKMLLNDEELWRSMSIAARKNAVERLGLDIFRNKFRDVIEMIRR